MSKIQVQLLKIVLLAVVGTFAVLTTGCRAQKKASGSGSGQAIERPKPNYEAMRDALEEREYDVREIKTLIDEASTWLGTPYRYTGTDKSGADCSGFLQQVFKASLGENIPRTSRDQHDACKIISQDELLPGDLVFYATSGDKNRVSHVALYIGNGEIVHSTTSNGIIISRMSQNYWANRFHSAGRPSCIDRIYVADSKKNSKKGSKNSKKKADSQPAPTQPSQPAPTQPTQPLAPAEPIVTTELVEATKEAPKPVEPIETAESIETTDSVEAFKAFEAVLADKEVETVETVEEVETVEAVEAVEATKPAKVVPKRPTAEPQKSDSTNWRDSFRKH